MNTIPALKGAVLVVEDDADIRELSVALLRSLGLYVIGVNNGKKALSIIEMFEIHLVLTALRMPEMNGADLIRTLKNIPQTRNVPIVVSSAAPLDDDQDILPLIAYRLHKPYDFDRLIDVVASLLHRSRCLGNTTSAQKVCEQSDNEKSSF